MINGESKTMENSQIYIIGAGAIGKALAVFLQQEGKQVVLVRGSVDNQSDVENLITVSYQSTQEFTQAITTTTLSNLTEINGIVLITAKAFANGELAEKLKGKKGMFSVVLLQNGLNVESSFESFDEVYRCVLLSTSQVMSDNIVLFKTVTASPVGSVKGENSNTDMIVNQINTPYFGFRSEPNIVKYVWNKVIVNCAFNSICPLLEIDNGIFYRDAEAVKLAGMIIDECTTLAQKYNIVLDRNEIEENLLLISKRADGQLISTYEDIRKKRRTEIESLNLEIARMADEIEMPELVPTTRLLGEMIKIKSEIKLS